MKTYGIMFGMEDLIENSTEIDESIEEELAEIHAKALTSFDKAQLAVFEERQQCLDDRRFCSIAGAQWEGSLGTYFENKPKLEVNKVSLSVIRIINEYRNNRISVDFRSKDGADRRKLASTCDGLYRSDEQDSNADEAYDNAFEEGVSGGFGAWRLRTEYEDEYDPEDERQRIRIEPQYDADSTVFFDPASKKQDKSDAKWAFILTPMGYDEYEDEYGEDAQDIGKLINSVQFDWVTDDTIYLAEYFKVELIKEVIKIYKDPTGKEERYSEEELDDDLIIRLNATGFEEVRSKTIKKRKIRKYIMNGARILEDCGYIAGDRIPIVPFYGKRWVIDGIERCMGHVRLARDSQILKNIQISKLAEISSLSSVEKPIVTPEQVKGLESYWKQDNVKNYPYLPIHPVQNADGAEAPLGPVGYTKPPMVPPALAALLGLTEQDMKEILGNREMAERVVSNISGEAIQKITDQLDMQTYIYVSNFAKAMKVCGEIWLSMAKDIYVEDDRDMKVINSGDETESITLNKLVLNNESNTTEYENDLSQAKFNIAVDVGPATSSKKQATISNLIKAMTASSDPETQNILSNLMMMNMEGEGIEDTYKYFRKKLIRQEVIEPSEEERKALVEELQNAEPSPQDQYFISEANKNNADTMKKAVETDKIKAQTAEILANIDMKDRETVLKTINQIMQMQENPQSAVSVPPQSY